MSTAYLVVGSVTVAATVFSGLAATLRPRFVLATVQPAMVTIGVPASWLVFPIGTLKLLGAAGLLAGLAGMPVVGTVAAFGLVLYFTCASYTHMLARDYSSSFVAACGFLTLAAGTLVLDPATG